MDVMVRTKYTAALQIVKQKFSNFPCCSLLLLQREIFVKVTFTTFPDANIFLQQIQQFHCSLKSSFKPEKNVEWSLP